jgi:hypothetical protein
MRRADQFVGGASPGELAKAVTFCSAGSRFRIGSSVSQRFQIQKLLTRSVVVLEASVGRPRGGQPGRENKSFRLPVCHEPNLRLASNFIVSTVVLVNSSEGVGSEEFGAASVSRCEFVTSVPGGKRSAVLCRSFLAQDRQAEQEATRRRGNSRFNDYSAMTPLPTMSY